jgi:hypothetical protein
VVDNKKQSLLYKAISAGAVALSVVVTRFVLDKIWRAVRGEAPPKGPDDRRVGWQPALMWAVAVGVGVAVARVVAVRVTADVWEAATHEAAPEPA